MEGSTWTGIFPRRSFLQAISTAVVGHFVPTIQANPGRSTSRLPLIYLHLDGGVSQIETFDPKPDSIPEVRGEWIGASDTPIPGVKLSRHLPRTAALLDKCTLIRALDTGSAAHDTSLGNMLKGPTNHNTVPTLALRWGDLAVNGGLPYCILIPPGYGGAWGNHDALRAHCNPTWVEGPTGREVIEGFYRRPELRRDPALEERRVLLDSFNSSMALESPLIRRMDQLQNMGLGILSGDCTFFDAFTLPEREKDRFGRTSTGYSCLLAKQLILRGAGAVTVNVREGYNFDLHSNAFPWLTTNLPKVDQALACLIEDIDQERLRAVLMVTGEFGRTVRVNSSAGRDHFPEGNCILFCGGKFRKGAVLGRTNAMGHPNGAHYRGIHIPHTVIKACGGEIDPRDPRIGDALAD